MDEDNNKPDKKKFKLLDFEKERAKLEEQKEELEVDDDRAYYDYLLKLYTQCLSSFEFIPSETNYDLARTKLREAFNHALSIVDLDSIDEMIDSSMVIIDFDDDEEDGYEELTTADDIKLPETVEELEQTVAELEQMIEDHESDEPSECPVCGDFAKFDECSCFGDPIDDETKE